MPERPSWVCFFFFLLVFFFPARLRISLAFVLFIYSGGQFWIFTFHSRPSLYLNLKRCDDGLFLFFFPPFSSSVCGLTASEWTSESRPSACVLLYAARWPSFPIVQRFSGFIYFPVTLSAAGCPSTPSWCSAAPASSSRPPERSPRAVRPAEVSGNKSIS